MKYTDNFKWQVPELSDAGNIENVTQVFDSVDESLKKIKDDVDEQSNTVNSLVDFVPKKITVLDEQVGTYNEDGTEFIGGKIYEELENKQDKFGTLTGSAINIKGKRIGEVAEPEYADDAATKSYVDNAIKEKANLETLTIAEVPTIEQIIVYGSEELTEDYYIYFGEVEESGEKYSCFISKSNPENSVLIMLSAKPQELSVGNLVHIVWFASPNGKIEFSDFTVLKDVSDKQDKLTAGNGITIENDVISATGGEGVSPYQIEGYEEIGNLVYKAECIPDKYINWNVTNNLKLEGGSNYTTYIFPIEKNTDYIVNRPRAFALLEDDKQTIISIDGSNPATFSFNSGNASYVAWSTTDQFNPQAAITKGTTLVLEEKWIRPNWSGVPQLDSRVTDLEVNAAQYKPVQHLSTESNYLSGVSNSIMKNVVISFSSYFTEFTNAIIGMTSSNTWSTGYTFYFTITSENIVYTGKNGTATDKVETILHGLNLSNFLNVYITWTYNRMLTVQINTLSGSFAHTVDLRANGFSLHPYSSRYPFYEINATNVTDSKISYTCKDFNKPIFVFGDSYLALSNSRWPSYLTEEQLDNMLLNGYGGEYSGKAIEDLKNILPLGNPKYVLWCLGMNDTADTDVISSYWLGYVNQFLGLAEQYHFIPVFCTIPSVPNKNNEYKNEWIRNSGYRYIDFAKAVGATANGTWYQGLLSSDNVHPNVAGGKALYARLLTDFPEIDILEK